MVESVRQSSMALQALGCFVEVASCDASDSTYLQDTPFPVHALGPGRGGYQLTPHLVPWLLANSPRFDAVIANGLWQFPSYAVRKAMRQLGKPYLIFTHGMLDPWFKRTYPLKHLKKALYWPVGEYQVLRDAAAVLFTCEEERILARKSFRMYRANEYVVQFGTAAPRGNPVVQRRLFFTQFPQLKDKPFILFLSRIHPKKGIDLLISAFAQIYRDGPHQLVIAGPDQVGLMTSLKQLAVKLNIQDRIHWPGMLSGDLKWGAFHACESFALPSHQENFGIVIAEAMACQKPVLISNKVNIWREVEAASAGLIEDDSEAGVTNLLGRWKDLPDVERGHMAVNATACFKERFEVQAATVNLLQILESIGTCK